MVISDLKKANKIISSALENLTSQLSGVTEKIDALEVELESNRSSLKQKDLELNILKEQLSQYEGENKPSSTLNQESFDSYFSQLKESIENSLNITTKSLLSKQVEILNPFQEQLKELESKLNNISNNVHDLQAKIQTKSEIIKDSDEYQARNHDLQMVGTELAEKIAKLEEIREQNQATISEFQRKHSEYEQKIKTLNEEIDILNQSKYQLETELKEKTDVSSSEDRLNAIREEFKDVEEKYIQEITNLKGQLEILQEFKKKSINIVDPIQIENSNEFKEKIVKLESENMSLRKQVQTFDRIIDDIRKSEQELDSDTKFKEEEIALIQSEKEGLIEKVTQLQLSLDNIENKVNQRDREIVQLKNELQQQINQKQSEQTVDDNLKESLIVAEKTLREAQELLRAKNEENVNIKGQLSKLKDDNILLEKTQSDIKTQAEMIDKLQNQVYSLENDLKNTQKALEQKEAELLDSQRSSSKRRSSSRILVESPVRLESLTNLSPEELREKLKTFLQNIIDLESDLDSAEDDIENLESEIVKIKESNESLRFEMNNKSQLLDSRTAQLENLAKEFEDVRNKLESNKEDKDPEIVNRFKSVIEDKDYKIRRLEEQQIHDQSQIAKLEANLEKISEENNQLKLLLDND